MQPIHFLAAGCSELPHRDGSSNGVHSRQNRDGTKQLYGLWPTRVPTSRRRCLLFPSRGYWKRRVPETSPCHGQAKQSGKLDPRKVTGGCRERSRGIETSTELVGRQSQRIGSVRQRLCTWAASAGSCERKPAVTDAAANPSVRGRVFAAGESCGIAVPDVDSRAMRSLLCLSSPYSSPRRAQVGSTGVVHDFLYTLCIVSYLFAQNISLFPSLSRYSGEEKEGYAKNRRKSNACCLLHT